MKLTVSLQCVFKQTPTSSAFRQPGLTGDSVGNYRVSGSVDGATL